MFSRKLYSRGATVFCVLLLCLLLIPCTVELSYAARKTFSPAFKTLGVWNKARTMRVDVNVWYPTYSQPSRASYGEWVINVVRFGRAVEGRFPLIILSHDSAATRFSYYNTAELLARSGFVVMAPDHKNDNLQRMTHFFTWKQLEERMDDVNTILTLAETHKDVRSMIDSSRVGFLGFGTGATVGLLLGGARIDASGWNNYCTHVPQSTLYCNTWAKQHLQKMIKQLPSLEKSFTEKRIKAVMAVAPKYDMFFTAKALQSIHVPFMLVEAQKELGKKNWNANNLQQLFPSQTQYALIDNIEARDLMAPCPQELKKDLPDLCGTATPKVRKAAHKIFSDQLLYFFLEQLGKSS